MYSPPRPASTGSDQRSRSLGGRDVDRLLLARLQAISFDFGIYVLIIRLDENAVLKIGSLGRLHLKRGHYAYVGSAQRGLKARIRRHLSSNKRMRWHIDYLLSPATIEDIIVAPMEGHVEEDLSVYLSIHFKFIPGFGSSDSRAPSHLFTGDVDLLRQMTLEFLTRKDQYRHAVFIRGRQVPIDSPDDADL